MSDVEIDLEKAIRDESCVIIEGCLASNGYGDCVVKYLKAYRFNPHSSIVCTPFFRYYVIFLGKLTQPLEFDIEERPKDAVEVFVRFNRLYKLSLLNI